MNWIHLAEDMDQEYNISMENRTPLLGVS